MALTKIGTDGVKDDAITSGKIPANAVGSSEIADTSVTLAKLEHGTPSNDGKFLRANNGADPTFESLPASGVTVSNNADNRVITGDGTNLNAESTITYDNPTLTISTSTSAYGSVSLQGTAGGYVDFKNTGGRLYEIYTNSNEFTLYDRQNTRYHSKFKAGGELELVNGNLKLANGFGIDFSATGDASLMQGSISGYNPSTGSEVLKDYEHGTWTPRIRAYDHTGGAGWGTLTYTDGSEVNGTGRYVKTGNFVWAGFKIESGSKVFDSNWTYFSIDSVPYGANHYDKASGSVYVNYTNFFTNTNSHIGGFVHGPDAHLVVNKPNGVSNATIDTSNSNRYLYGHIAFYTTR